MSRKTRKFTKKYRSCIAVVHFTLHPRRISYYSNSLQLNHLVVTGIRSLPTPFTLANRACGKQTRIPNF